MANELSVTAGIGNNCLMYDKDENKRWKYKNNQHLQKETQQSLKKSRGGMYGVNIKGR